MSSNPSVLVPPGDARSCATSPSCFWTSALGFSDFNSDSWQRPGASFHASTRRFGLVRYLFWLCLIVLNGAYGAFGGPVSVEAGAAPSGSALVEEVRLALQEAGGDGEWNDGFGTRLAVMEGMVLVAAQGDDLGALPNAGSVHVFREEGGRWVHSQKLIASDPQAEAFFGSAIAHHADLLAISASGVGSPGEISHGAVYVYKRTQDEWVFQQKLVPGPGNPGAQMGWSLDIGEDRLIAGGGAYNGFRGAAYVFHRSNDQWSAAQRLLMPDAASNDYFGKSVAISGDMALVGAHGDNIGSIADHGSVSLFRYQAGAWVFSKKLLQEDPNPEDRFGWRLSLSDGFLLATRDSFRAEKAAYVYRLVQDDWVLQQRIGAWALGGIGDFAYDAVMHGGRMFVTARYGDLGPAGIVYAQQDGRWEVEQTVTHQGISDEFGSSIAAGSACFIIGAPRATPHGSSDQGDAHLYCRSTDQWEYRQQLTNGTASRSLGTAVALVGDTLAATLWRWDDQRAAAVGRVNVFRQTPTGWVSEQHIAAPENGGTGFSVGNLQLQADLMVVGWDQAPGGGGANAGAVYIYERDQLSSWSLRQKLVAFDGRSGQRFGAVVSLDGSTLAVGMPEGTGSSSLPGGSVYVFRREGAQWVLEAKLLPNDPSAIRRFGMALALQADTLVVGAPSPIGAVNGLGAVYVFRRSGGQWQEVQKLPGSIEGAEYGAAVAMRDGWMMIGSPKKREQWSYAGEVSVYREVGGVWVEQQRLANPAVGSMEQFGATLVLSGNRLFVGAPSTDDRPGQVVVFDRVGDQWGSSGLSALQTGEPEDGFGRAIAVDGLRVAVGAPWKAGELPFGNGNDGQVIVYAVPHTDLSISKSDGLTQVQPGESTVYDIVVRNQGPLRLAGVRVKDPVAQGLGNVAWMCEAIDSAVCPVAMGVGSIDQYVDLPIQGALRFVYSAEVTAAPGVYITNTASVIAPPGYLELDPTDNTALDRNRVIAADTVLADGFED